MTARRHESDALARLAEAIAAHRPAAFSCSFGREDMVVLHLLSRLPLPVEVFTIDTGRLPPETHELIALAQRRFGRPVRILAPQAAAIEEWTADYGPEGFRASLDARRACCAVRKVEPLARALEGKRLWITGLTRAQAVSRAAIEVLSHDAARGLFKLSPLADWSDEQVDDYLARNEVPINALHARGYPSIGCAPCTRAVAPGEDPRAGRWWWEAPATKECGLHLSPDGRLSRARASQRPIDQQETA